MSLKQKLITSLSSTHTIKLLDAYGNLDSSKEELYEAIIDFINQEILASIEFLSDLEKYNSTKDVYYAMDRIFQKAKELKIK